MVKLEIKVQWHRNHIPEVSNVYGPKAHKAPEHFGFLIPNPFVNMTVNKAIEHSRELLSKYPELFSGKFTSQFFNMKQLLWYGHMRRMEQDRIPQMIWKWRPANRRKKEDQERVGKKESKKLCKKED
ncbi:hypothetical protein NQ317_008336 [Molorchus minor]|uniref:Uncharacterized protein n=1 Tax=Molorchus minor TaxID=1323400 RepID=A0ABQ9JQI7_9CUCU|nr:hypothetical protein NQ317_008336 [Molorchus minor]